MLAILSPPYNTQSWILYDTQSCMRGRTPYTLFVKVQKIKISTPSSSLLCQGTTIAHSHPLAPLSFFYEDLHSTFHCVLCFVSMIRLAHQRILSLICTQMSVPTIEVPNCIAPGAKVERLASAAIGRRSVRGEWASLLDSDAECRGSPE